MKYLDRTLPTPAANLAVDELLLERCEADGEEVLRTWMSGPVFVVLGYANRIDLEVRRAVCEERGIPILRRITGGGTVVQGPGVFNYAVTLRADRPGLEGIPQTNARVLERIGQAIQAAGVPGVTRRGDTDLCLGTRKFSGNAQRRARRSILFHGSFLLEPDLDLIESLLPPPSRSPAYRDGRTHRDFLCPLEVPVGALKASLRSVWEADRPAAEPAGERVAALVRERYDRPEWNRRF